jgi:mono/diheme cytochrome c family protein
MQSGPNIKNRLLRKFIAYIIGAVVVSAVTYKVGFPPLFIGVYNIYVFACFLFYVIIDLPPIKLTRFRTYFYLVMTFVVAAVVYMIVALILPQFSAEVEIAYIRQPPIELSALSTPELIEAGKDVVRIYECMNCHTIGGKGATKTRGPKLGNVGWESMQYIKESILNPLAWVSKEFDKPKLRDAMPDFFHEDFTEGEYGALLAYVQSLKPETGKMPRDWWTNWRIILEGKDIFDGAYNPSVNCSVCHGRDGKPVMSGARDLRDADAPGSSKTTESRRRPFKEWSDEDFFEAESKGVPHTPMPGWEIFLNESDLWKVVSYVATFSGVRGVTQDDLKAYLASEHGKGLLSYRASEEARQEEFDELESGIGGDEDEDAGEEDDEEYDEDEDYDDYDDE